VCCWHAGCAVQLAPVHWSGAHSDTWITCPLCICCSLPCCRLGATCSGQPRYGAEPAADVRLCRVRCNAPAASTVSVCIVSLSAACFGALHTCGRVGWGATCARVHCSFMPDSSMAAATDSVRLDECKRVDEFRRASRAWAQQQLVVRSSPAAVLCCARMLVFPCEGAVR
jgi:hypothetical protein